MFTCDHNILKIYVSLFLLSVSNLPKKMFYGPKMIPTPDFKGALLTHGNEIYELNCFSLENCQWKKKSQNLEVSRKGHILLHIPIEFLKKC